MNNDTPRTGDALAATLDAGFDLGPQHRVLTELCRELERENVMLRKCDTCARECEGTAYRIEGQRLRHHLTELAKVADRAALVLATIEAENRQLSARRSRPLERPVRPATTTENENERTDWAQRKRDAGRNRQGAGT